MGDSPPELPDTENFTKSAVTLYVFSLVINLALTKIT